MRGTRPTGRMSWTLRYRCSEQEQKARIVSERFYSGRHGQVTVRDGIGGAKKRPLEPRVVLFKHGKDKFARPSDSSGRAQIAFTLLADALGDEARAIEAHEYFSRRVVTLFPERWTITRSRVLAYVDMFELEKRAGLAAVLE